MSWWYTTFIIEQFTCYIPWIIWLYKRQVFAAAALITTTVLEQHVGSQVTPQGRVREPSEFELVPGDQQHPALCLCQLLGWTEISLKMCSIRSFVFGWRDSNYSRITTWTQIKLTISKSSFGTLYRQTSEVLKLISRRVPMAIITISQCVSANATTHHLLLSVYSVSTSTTGSTNSG